MAVKINSLSAKIIGPLARFHRKHAGLSQKELADIAGVQMDKSGRIDGRSFLAQLKGQEGNPRKWVFSQYRKKHAIRTRYWKLNHYGWLFDLKEDPFEIHPIMKSKDTIESAAVRKNFEKMVMQMFDIRNSDQ